MLMQTDSALWRALLLTLCWPICGASPQSQSFANVALMNSAVTAIDRVAFVLAALCWLLFVREWRAQEISTLTQDS